MEGRERRTIIQFTAPPADTLDSRSPSIRFRAMAVAMTKPKASPRITRARRQLGGRQLAVLLRKMDSAKSDEEKRRWRKEFMRGFYGDTRADAYA